MCKTGKMYNGDRTERSEAEWRFWPWTERVEDTKIKLVLCKS